MQSREIGLVLCMYGKGNLCLVLHEPAWLSKHKDTGAEDKRDGATDTHTR